MNASGRISPEWDNEALHPEKPRKTLNPDSDVLNGNNEALHLLREKSWKNTVTCLKADEGIKTSSSEEKMKI